MAYTKYFNNLPESIQNLLQYSVTQLNPEKIVLFGSRARNTARENSDFDFAFFNIAKKENWSRFVVDKEEENFTLYQTDCMLFEEMNDEYKINIQKEGVVIYER